MVKVAVILMMMMMMMVMIFTSSSLFDPQGEAMEGVEV